jgi:tetratricopeptide (TPR) repeat protein
MRTRSYRVSVAVRLVSALLAMSSAVPATAQETGDAMDDARTHFEQGVALAGEDKWEEAQIEFGRSVEAYPTAPGLLNLGLSLRHLGRNVEALASFRRFLDEFGASADAQDITDAREQVTQLEPLLARLAIRVNVVGAALAVDERGAGSAPLAEPVWVEAGTHEVVARDGDRTARETVTVGAGEQIDVELAFDVVPVVGPGDETGAAAAADGGIDPVVFWSLLGVTGAAAVAWGVTGGLALDANSDYSADPHRPAADQDSGKALAIGADVCGAVALAAAAATLVVAFFVDWDGDGAEDEGSSAEAVAVSAGPFADGFGLGVAGRF